MPRQLHTQSVTGKTQANGAFAFAMPTHLQCLRHHQLQLEVSATPTGGSLAVAVKSVGASGYATFSSGLNMTAAPPIYEFTGYVESIRITPSGFDADKTYSLILNSGGAPVNV